MSVEKKVPEIRFAGFSGEWEEKELGTDVADIVGGGTPNTLISEFWNGDIDWYSPTEIGSNVYAEGSQKKITTLGLNSSSAKILPAGNTVLFTSRAGIGDMAILTKPGTTNQGFQSFVVKERFSPYFIYSAGKQIKEYALKHASGSTFLEISGKQLGRMKILIPYETEQTAIGNTFQKLDNLINQHQQKHDKLSNIKKAMLEKMFPKQGETIPEIRFKGFSGEWEHSTIGDCSSLITKGTTPMTIGRSFVNSGVTFVKVESLDEMGNLNPSKFAHIDMETDQILARSRIKENDLLVSIAGALGRAAIVKKEILPANTNQALAIVRLKNDSPVTIEFLYHFTKTKDFKDFVDASASQGAQPNLSLGDISNVRILAPKKEEQAAIGNYFQKLDALINQHQQQITKLNNIKQACLSKMFV
ncbi:restriction endonuclease subunit S [Thiopseudomonas alkaliphila]|uniref:restriction endonuclease subunit S n=1 Tax=Thiopseudomonas alkaliphila TaxID=1697053 RepID=UPI0006A2C471|nr:restriction endonuclease subunit S [Thiopseudomonas alkaliphila]AKX53068.1 hypothetical protein AKN91_04825 [Thiopseudomonas alkaliphila]